METPQTGARTLLILTNLPDEASAQALATTLVSARLAACVNMLAPCRSVYRWQDAIESAQEIPLLIKATATRAMPALEAAIRAAHPYELPEIIAVPIASRSARIPRLGRVAETRTSKPAPNPPNGKPRPC
jgi:periplasmic divalent cation tolerance protein